jgi:hypothetical protein
MCECRDVDERQSERAFSVNGSPAVADYLVLATENPRAAFTPSLTPRAVGPGDGFCDPSSRLCVEAFVNDCLT